MGNDLQSYNKDSQSHTTKCKIKIRNINMINDPFIDINELDSELKDMQKIAETLDTHFPLLSQKIAYIFAKIKECKTFKESQNYFEFLEIIKTGLACLLYKYNIGLPDHLLRFTRDFDNLEPIYQEYYFKKITSGEYKF